MYKVLLVDDEYMITEGLKRLIPFGKWDMEVVATANHADEALDYVREHLWILLFLTSICLTKRASK